MCSRWTEVCLQLQTHELTWDDVFNDTEIVKWLTEYEFTVHTVPLPIDPLLRYLERARHVYAATRVVKSLGHLSRLGPLVKSLRSRRGEVLKVLGLFMHLGDQFQSVYKLLLEWRKDSELRVLCLACLQSGVEMQKKTLPKHVRQQCTQAGVRFPKKHAAPKSTVLTRCSCCTPLITSTSVGVGHPCWFRKLVLRK
jgi:hypothetical protein